MKSIPGLIEYKNVPFEVKDIDVTKRTVTGYLSAFGNKDFDDDVIVKGAFTKTIRERGPQGTNEIFFLNQHNWDQPLGKPTVLREDEKGLYHETPVNVKTTYADDALKLMEAGLVVQNSIGFSSVKWSTVDPDGDWKTSYREISEIKLYEGSCVTLGANDQTPFTGLKNLTIPQLNDQISKMVKLLRDGTLTDDGFARLEIGLKQLQYQAFIVGKDSVNTNEPPLSTQDTNPNSTLINSLINVLQN